MKMPKGLRAIIRGKKLELADGKSVDCPIHRPQKVPLEVVVWYVNIRN
jgi:hypothetical protein